MTLPRSDSAAEPESGMSARLTTTPQRISMQAAVVSAFMIVDSFGHYSAQTVHDHGPPAARHEYPVALCRSMHKHAQRATPAHRQIRAWVEHQAMRFAACRSPGSVRQPVATSATMLDCAECTDRGITGRRPDNA